MINKQTFKHGLMSYLDSEVIPHLPTTGKWGLGALIFLSQDNLDQIIENLSNNSIVQAMGIINGDEIDIDKLSEALRQSAIKYGNMQIRIPIIGSMSFNSNDVERLREYMR